jgi:DNA-binding transcriptional LysR family regulator
MTIRFDLRQLRYFIAVADTASFRQAAEQLHLSQPPLSRQIRALEDALGAALFVRSKQGVSLTKAGQTLLPRARRLLSDAQTLANDLPKDGSTAGLRIGTSVAVAPPTLARVVDAWETLRSVSVMPGGYSTTLIEQLRAGAFDAVLAGLPGDTAGLVTATIDHEALRVVLPRSHSAARKRVVSLALMADLPLFWWPRKHNPAYYDHCMGVFRRLQFSPEMIFVEPAQFLTLERIGRGEGFTLMNARRSTTRVPGVTSRPLAESPLLQIELALIWRDPALADCMQAFAEAARDVIAADKQTAEAAKS